MGEYGIVWFLSKPNLLEDWAIQKIEHLPEFRRSKALRYRFSKDKTQSVVTFCLLCSMLEFIPNDFIYNKNEKPYLMQGTPFFNITHSEECIAVALSNFEVGIDSETVRKQPQEIMPNVFTKKEISMIENSKNPDKTFFKVWTLKESYIKALGTGFYFPLKKVEFIIKDESILCSDLSFKFSTFSAGNSQISVCGSENFSFKKIRPDELKCKWEELQNV